MARFKLGDPVIYRGKTYTFPGRICGITDDGQYVVRALGTPEGYYAGMKHLFGESQLEPFISHECEANSFVSQKSADLQDNLQKEIVRIRSETIEECAKLIEENIIQDTSAGKVLRPRQDGNQDGLHFAAAIRALPIDKGVDG